MKKRKPVLGRRRLFPVFMTFTVFVSECIQIFLWTVKKSGYEVYQLHLLLVLAAIPLLVIVGVLLALFQRIREIGKGEADDARQY